MHPSISIIVPVYNAEVYLFDCLNSIQSQTLMEFEVILVDDDSTDGSLQILKDSKLRILVFSATTRGTKVLVQHGMLD